MSSFKDEKYEMAGSIRYTNFSDDYEKIDGRKEKNRSIERHKGILKYLTKEWEITTE